MDKTNPGAIYGGTWELFSKGRVLVGVNPDNSEFSDIDKQGGEYKHTLTVNEIPNHNHRENTLTYTDTSCGRYFNNDGGGTWLNNRSNLYTDNTGGGQAHNNMQPYVTCFIWKRIL